MSNKPQLKAVGETLNHRQRYSDELELWVYSGLLAFWRRALPTDSGIYSLLNSRVRHIGGCAYSLDWPAADQRWRQLLAQDQELLRAHLPLLQLAEDYQISDAQLFVLALVGLVESSHLVNLAIGELQAPDIAPRPCLHFICALMENLFPESSPYSCLDISEQPLVNARVLELSGDVPLPLQRLAINSLLWSILLGRLGSWPRCQLHLQKLPSDTSLSPARLAEVSAIAASLHLQKTADTFINGVVIRGNPNSGRGLFCQQLASTLGLVAIDTPLDIWQNQIAFSLACRYARWLPVLRPHLASAETIQLPLAGGVPKNPVAIILGSDGASEGSMLEVVLSTPPQQERYQLWLQYLGGNAQQIAQHLSSSALLSASAIQFVAQQACQLAQQQHELLALPHIAQARRKLGADKLRLLAQPVNRDVTLQSLVVPVTVEQALDALVLRACKREALWNDLGSTLTATPNPGVRALFVGESGTGKTLAASYIATRLAAPLYRVDLSAVMNKYIGESEKHLAQLLDHAAANDVVLLFDEADALFGSRSEGQENGERFANMLTNFLLTRIETHPGIVILTTNSRERIDTAFTRRIDSIVEFPLPGFSERLLLWRSHLGERGPGEYVYRHLASTCDLAGGQLRNVVLTAAVYAQGYAISNANLLEGLRAEYRKQGRDLPKKLEALAQQQN